VPRLSIVIPCQTCDERFENTLASVLQNRPADAEVIVVFAGVYDDPYDLCDEVRFVEVSADAPVTALLQAGIELAHGDIVHLLQCGVEVEDGWTRAPLQRFNIDTVGSVAPVVLNRNAPTERGTAGLRYGRGGRRKICDAVIRRDERRVPRILGPSWQAAFYRREAISRIGGIDPAVGAELADVDLALSLQSAGYTTVCETSSRVLVSEAAPVPTKSFSQAARSEYLFWKHAGQQGWLRSLIAHLFLVTGEVLQLLVSPGTFVCLLGRLYGSVRRPPCPEPQVCSEKHSRRRYRSRGRTGSGPRALDAAAEPKRQRDTLRRNVA